MTTPLPPDAARAAFEAWLLEEHAADPCKEMMLYRNYSGTYAQTYVQGAWLGFSAAYRLMAKDAEPSPEIAWLCERGGDGPTMYVYIGPSGFFDWTEDVNKALRLCRKEDADAVAAIVDDCWRVAEHAWVPK